MTPSTRQLLAILTCALLSPWAAVAQKFDTILDTQAKVDAFDPSYLTTQGVHISGADITNLDHLAIFTHFESLFIQNNPNLVSIAGLSNVATVHSLSIINNGSLTSIDVLADVAIGGDLTIEDNAQLAHLPSFNGTATVNGSVSINGNPELSAGGLGSIENITGRLFLSDNPKLLNLTGFHSVKSLGELWIANMPITTLDGFSLLTDLNGIRFADNPNLVDISGFVALQRLGSVDVSNNANLTRIDGFSVWNEMITPPGAGSTRLISLYQNPKLVSMEAFSKIQTLDVITIEDNEALKDVDGLRGLRRLPDNCRISIINNSSLENLDGFAHVNEIVPLSGISFLTVTNNTTLTKPCGLFPFLQALNNIQPGLFDRIIQGGIYSNFSGNGFAPQELKACGDTQPPYTAPLVHLNFDEANSVAPSNSGSASATFLRSEVSPVSIANGPSQAADAKSFDFGTIPGNYFVESTAPIPELSSLSEFTITGWLNAKSAATGSGGNRIVSWIRKCGICGEGADLVVEHDGRLKIGVDGWPDNTSGFSNEGKITVDPTGASDNWVFFAVTYTSSNGEVKFYFGSNASEISLDRTAIIEDAGITGAKIGKLAIGAFNDGIRKPDTYDRMFRGAIDDIRIYGTALNFFNIRAVQFENRDLIAPAKPTLSVSTKTATSVTLQWETPTDNVGTTNYLIIARDLGDGSGRSEFIEERNTYNFADLRAGSTQRIYLEAWDRSSNFSIRDSIDVVLEKMPSTDGSVVHIDFNDTGLIYQNIGSANATFTRSPGTPLLSNNTPSLVGGANSIDYGVAPSDFFVTSSSPIDDLKNLDAFTITGWVNARSQETGSGGNSVVSWINNGGDGVHLVVRNDGSLQLGVNQWPDSSPAFSSANKVPADNTVPASNWVFFAVTYQSDGQVQFYFGNNANDAAVDVVRTYAGRGAAASNIGNLAVGVLNESARNSSTYDRMFKGLIDDIRVYNTVLSPANVIAVQRGTILTGDLVPPSAPLSAFNTSKTETTAEISWTAPPDNASITGYQIFSESTLIAEVGVVTTYTVTGLTAATSYEFTVKAKDVHGNVSSASNHVTVTTNGREDQVTAIENETSEATRLSQNFPNPFNDHTTIELYVPRSVTAARVSVHDLTGRVLQEFEITERGDTHIQIHCQNLTAGLYYYSLTIDGNRKDTKRMALTK